MNEATSNVLVPLHTTVRLGQKQKLKRLATSQQQDMAEIVRECLDEKFARHPELETAESDLPPAA